MKKRKVFIVLLIATILYICFIATSLNCFGADNKPVSQSTSKENAIRKANYNACVASGKPRSYCYYLYFS